MKKVSVMIPTFNEEDNVEFIAQAVKEQFEELKDYDYEILFIDNDSLDSTRDKIRELCASDKRIKAIFNAKNYGQFNSPYYGILQATGDCVIAMSADFQDPPEMIPRFIAEWEKGYKIVMGQKTSSKENRIVYALRGMYYKFMEKHSDYGFLQQVTGFGLYDREFVEIMRKVDDPHPFLRGVVTEMGYKITTIAFEQPKRRAGKSSNNFAKYYDGAVQSFTAYTKTGIRLIMAFGVFFTILSLLTVVGCFVYKLLNWNTWDVGPLLLPLAIFVIVSLQTFFLGIVGEYVLNINSYTRRRPMVIESERINF